MGQPLAKKGDQVTAIDTHLVQVPGAGPMPIPHPFLGLLDGALTADVNVMGQPAATVDSTATNTPPHIATGGSFVNPPKDKGTIKAGSGSVNINGKAAARSGD